MKIVQTEYYVRLVQFEHYRVWAATPEEAAKRANDASAGFTGDDRQGEDGFVMSEECGWEVNTVDDEGNPDVMVLEGGELPPSRCEAGPVPEEENEDLPGRNVPKDATVEEIRAYVLTHLDPHRELRPHDDAADVVAELDRVFEEEGGAGITVAQMQRYLDSL